MTARDILRPVDVWVGRYDHPSRSRKALRNAAGDPITGFLMREGPEINTMIVASNGCVVEEYSFPAMPAPAHRMLRWANVAMCGGFDLRYPDGTDSLSPDVIWTAVLHGAKPAGDLWFDEAREERANAARSEGFEVILYGDREVMIGVNKPLGEMFDLAEISAYYEAIFDARELCATFSAASPLTPLAALARYDWANSRTPAELALTGLCLGYALESTAARIG